jgi:hypothetical protein
MIKEPLLRDIHPEGRAESNLPLPGTVQVVEIEIIDWEGAAQRRRLPDLSAGHGVDRGDHRAGCLEVGATDSILLSSALRSRIPGGAGPLGSDSPKYGYC